MAFFEDWGCVGLRCERASVKVTLVSHISSDPFPPPKDIQTIPSRKLCIAFLVRGIASKLQAAHNLIQGFCLLSVE